MNRKHPQAPLPPPPTDHGASQWTEHLAPRGNSIHDAHMGTDNQIQQMQGNNPNSDQSGIDRGGRVPWMSTTQQQPMMGDMESQNGDSQSTPRPTATSLYPHQNLSLSHPSLSLDFRMSVNLNSRIDVGVTPFGQRNWISFSGGSWSGTWGNGIVMPGGQDIQVSTPNGTHMETNYILQTHDDPPAHIMISTNGWRTGSPEILAQLADPEKADQVNPNSYKFRLFITMETGDERYSDKVNRGMWVGSGMRLGNEVLYDAYRLS